MQLKRIRLLIGLGTLAVAAVSQPAAAAPTVTSLTLNPATVTGGTGGTSTGTVTLSEPAPPGGTVLSISSANTELAASVPSITVPAGATSATFTVATNALYRRYSGLAFTVSISVANPANGSSRSATLTVTAQARPPDVIGPDSDMQGLHCGGDRPDIGILLDCAPGPNDFTPGPCSFVEECALGCQDLPDEFTTLNAECAATAPFPASVNPTYVVGGGSVQGTSRLPEPAPADARGFVFSTSPFATASSPTNFSFPAGATSIGFTVSTQAVGVPTFVAIQAQNVVPEPSPGGGTFFAARTGLVWLTLAPPPNAPHPVLTSLIIDPPSVRECESSRGTLTVSPAPAGQLQVLLDSDRPGVVDIPNQLPFSVIVPAGATSATFDIGTQEVSATTSVNISATLTGVTVTDTLTVTNLTGPTVFNLTLDPSTVVGGNSSTGTVRLTGAAPPGGTVVTLTSHAPTVAMVHPSVTVPAGQITATFPVSTAPVDFGTVVSIAATVGCVTQTASLMVTTPPPDPVLASVALSPTSVTGGSPSTGTVTLTGAAPSGGQAVTLSSSNTAVATVPASVTVAAGATSATFTVTTSAVTSSTVVTVTGASGGASQTANLTVLPSGGGTPGFLSATANAADTGGDGNGFEAGPTNAQADDGVTAADNNSGTGTGTSCTSSGKDRHRFYNYGFAVPDGAVIAGLEVGLDARADSTSGSPKMCVQLSWDGGTSWTAAKATARLGTGLATYTLGSSSDTWGRTWSAADLADARFRVRVVDVSSSTSRDFFLDWVGVRVSAAEAGPENLSAVSLSPATVVGKDPSTGTVTLTSAAPGGGAVVTLTSSNTAVATVPASVTVAQGATSASFMVSTQPVNASTSVTISGTYRGLTLNATLTVNPQAGDTVAVQVAEYDDRDEELRVEATSTSGSATLQVFVTSTGQLIGTLTNNGGGRYSRTFAWPSNPQNITVRSSLGGSASRNVRLN